MLAVEATAREAGGDVGVQQFTGERRPKLQRAFPLPRAQRVDGLYNLRLAIDQASRKPLIHIVLDLLACRLLG